MKVILFFLMAVVALQLPTEGESKKLFRKRNLIPLISKMSLEMSNEISSSSSSSMDLSSGEMTVKSPSDLCRLILSKAFGSKGWRELMVTLASEEQLQDPDFVTKVGFTEEEIQAIQDKEQSVLTSEEVEKLSEFFLSDKWRGLMALQATKKELMNERYRERWGLGDLTDDVKNADEGGSFFRSPQYYEYMKHIGLRVVEGTPDSLNAALFSMWFVQTFEKLAMLKLE